MAAGGRRRYRSHRHIRAAPPSNSMRSAASHAWSESVQSVPRGGRTVNHAPERGTLCPAMQRTVRIVVLGGALLVAAGCGADAEPSDVGGPGTGGDGGSTCGADSFSVAGT